jgi:hypothetical protein
VKPPDKEPSAVTQAADVTKLGEEGLENEQVVSVGKNPLPLIETCKPTLTLPELNAITGSDSTFFRTIDPLETAKRHMKSSATTNLNETRNNPSALRGIIICDAHTQYAQRFLNTIKGTSQTVQFTGLAPTYPAAGPR